MSEKIEIKKLNLFYGDFHALIDVNLGIPEKRVTSIIGPSGCGKSTLLRCLNRMNDLVEGVRVTGSIKIDNIEVCSPNTDLISLRQKVGMVFQRPNPFPLSIFENVVYGLRISGTNKRSVLEEVAEKSLSEVLLFDDLKDKLSDPALGLTLEQQQKLCIARVIAMRPEVILLDEPCSTLDPIATLKIEDLMQILKKDYSLVIVTHNMQQAARASDTTCYMLLGEMIECGETKDIFTAPKDKRTEDYISGRFG
ncbi:MAG: phosphate ABC transporter ATP-binding protein PstB [Candidatus Saganbacteria bacterium]|nr:phosphate ABC transporter ATP-binding protein PstB [Candidatus Saganbacteria bacterium]